MSVDPGSILWRVTFFPISARLHFSPGMGSIPGRAHFFPITFFPHSFFPPFFILFLSSNFFLPFSLPSFFFFLLFFFFLTLFVFLYFFLIFLPLSPGFVFSLSSLYFLFSWFIPPFPLLSHSCCFCLFVFSFSLLNHFLYIFHLFA